MGKSTHFSGQPLYSQVIKFMRKDRILQLSREHGSERYVKRFDCWTHLVVMLYAVIIFVPIALAYTIWAYRRMWNKVSAEDGEISEH